MEKRHIEPKLVDLIDKRLEKNGLAQHAIEHKDPVPLMVQAATCLVGIKEATGKNDGKEVELFQKTIGGAGHEPWCCSLVQSVVAYAEKKTGKESPLYATELCVALWEHSPKRLRVQGVPPAGSIMVFQDVGKQTGHVELVISSDGKTVHCIGGNTSGTTSEKQAVNREGNGCFYTVRTSHGTAKRRVLGYLLPFEKN